MDPFLLVQPVQLDQRNLTDENAELGVNYKDRLIDPVCSWQKKVVRQVHKMTELVVTKEVQIVLNPPSLQLLKSN